MRNPGRGTLEDPRRGIPGEESWKRNPGRGILEEESERRNPGGTLEEES